MSDFNIEKALFYIDKHIEEPLLLSDIANELGYSPFYVSRIFSQAMGISIVSYIRMRKLQYAFSSLQKSNSVLDVALQYSFESHEGFTRSFKRFFGFSPKVVKNQNITYAIPNYSDLIERNNELMKKNTMEEMHMMAFLLLKESIAEMKQGHCTEIQVTLLPDNTLEILDNGRGIPLVDEIQKSSEILNHIFGGHPMSSLDYASIEDFGSMELNMVSSLCEKMNVCVWRNDKSYSQDYINGVAQHELLIENASHPSGMKVTMKPNATIFGEYSWSKELFEDFIAKEAAEYTQNIIIK